MTIEYPLKDRYHRAFLEAGDVAATTWYILVDMSDTTNYDHTATTGFSVLSLDLTSEKASDGRFEVRVGVVLENDASNGTAQWIKTWWLEADGNPTESTDRFVGEQDFTICGTRPAGLDVEVVGGATPWITGTASGDQTALENDATNLTSAGGGSSLAAAVGDIVVYVNETTDGGTINLAIGCNYITH
jgi:hypothetical protein